MKTRKNLAVLASRMLTAIVMVMVCGLFVACNEKLDLNEGFTLKKSLNPTPDPGPGGIKIINDSLQEDSIPYEGVIYKTTLKRSLKALDRREVVVDNFDNQTFDETFTAVQGEEKYARQDGKFLIYGRETVYKKNVSVAGHVEEVSYTLYQERATFTLNSYKFDYIEWNVKNASDEFTAALISTMENKNELDYKNGIATSYYGYNQNASEVIAWFSGDEPTPEPQPEKPTYETTSDIKYTISYVTPSWEKIQINPDGSRETVEKDAANLPISVTPETNWTINVDKLGTYVSNSFNKTLISKTPRKSGNFSYNEYTYRVYNTVAGQTNSLLVKVPGDIVREKDDERQEYQTTELIVTKGAENTSLRSEDDSKKTYGYTCIANVIFGASQAVTLPGTIYVKKAEPEPEPENHEHGKIKEVLFTSTPNENRSYYKNVCVIVFEDGYRSIGMAENAAPTFNFNMSSMVAGINSTVYSGGAWIPAKAVDGSSYMTWYDETGKARRNLDYLTANRDRWNNGHNTVNDVERSAEISNDGYSVTLYRQNNAGQTLHF